MARDTRKHQQKIAKQKAKRQSRKREIAKRQSVGIDGRLTRVSAAPVLHCLVPVDIWKDGIGQILFSRELPNQQVAYACFLVDVWCLGVKDAFADIVPKSDYREGPYAGMCDQFDMRPQAPEYVRALIEGAVAYAAKFGLAPHREYHKVKAIFGDIEAAAHRERLDFGKDGQPFYIAGPYESTEQSQWIVQRLADHAGEGNYHYTIPVDAQQLAALGLNPEELELLDHAADEDDEYDDDFYEGDVIDSPPPARDKPKPLSWLH